MVGGQHDDRVVGQAESLELAEDAVDVMVDFGDESAVAVGHHPSVVSTALRVGVGVVVCVLRDVQLIGVVQIQESLRGPQGRVRTVEAGDAEERFGVAVPGQELHGAGGDEGAVAQLGRGLQRRERRIVVTPLGP